MRRRKKGESEIIDEFKDTASVPVRVSLCLTSPGMNSRRMLNLDSLSARLRAQSQQLHVYVCARGAGGDESYLKEQGLIQAFISSMESISLIETDDKLSCRE